MRSVIGAAVGVALAFAATGAPAQQPRLSPAYVGWWDCIDSSDTRNADGSPYEQNRLIATGMLTHPGITDPLNTLTIPLGWSTGGILDPGGRAFRLHLEPPVGADGRRMILNTVCNKVA